MEGALKTTVYLVATIAALASPIVATAKEVRVRCDISKSRALTNSAELNDSLNSQQETSTRHYVFDDTTHGVWRVLKGVRSSVCTSGEKCTLRYRPESITFEDNVYPRVYNITTIDRLAGSIEHQADTYDTQGRLLFRFIFTGKCYPESTTTRKF